MKLENISCYNCNTADTKPYDAENGYKLVKCRNCGLLYVNPRPDANEITKAALTGLHSGEKQFDKTHAFYEKKIPRYLNILKDLYHPSDLDKKTWLDIGCGHGEFMLALQEFTSNTINVKGTEPNIKKIESARQHGLDVESLDLDKLDVKYDIISILDVFSHLPNPVETLLKWSNLIKRGGEILIETGHSSHLPSRFHNKPYDLPDHLSFANKKILIHILEKAGFTINKVKIYRGIFYRDYTITNFSKEMIKFLLGRRNSFHSFFKPLQHGDMYIRAKKI